MLNLFQYPQKGAPHCQIVPVEKHYLRFAIVHEAVIIDFHHSNSHMGHSIPSYWGNDKCVV